MNLPNSKSGFPKCLYLDQNKWVDLARVHYGKSENKGHRQALDAVRSAIAAERLVVPFSHVHITETMAPTDSGRRRRLAEFMVDLSQNQSMLPDGIVRPLEIRNALLVKMGKQPDEAIRSRLIQQGLFGALGIELEVEGLPAGFDGIVREKTRAPMTSVDLLVNSADRTLLRQARSQAIRATVFAETARRRSAQDLTPEMRRRVELADLVVNGRPLMDLAATLMSLGISQEDFKGHFAAPDDYICFFHSIPTIDVVVSLIRARDRDLDHPVHRNDAADVIFLSVAVPYSNIIVLEKFWARLVQSTGLDRKYATPVLTDVSDLGSRLISLGCL